MRPVVLVSNDVVPGMGVPVAAPGLRVFGLERGLQAAGVPTTVVVVAGPVARSWKASVPVPIRPGIEVVGAAGLRPLLKAHGGCVVVLTNGNQIDNVGDLPRASIVLDFFAPKMLEFSCANDGLETGPEYDELRERKLRAIAGADAFIVNGHKKVPYFRDWLAQAGGDALERPFEVVEMAVPSHFREHQRDELEVIIAGYLQGWSMPGPWLDSIADHVGREEVRLNLLLPRHWAQTERLESETLSRVAGLPGVRRHQMKLFSDFQALMATQDLSIDLFEWNAERELAMVTRSIVALACGTPVIHPPFTEVSPMIEEYDAGWVLDPGDIDGLEAILLQVESDRVVLDHKRENAMTLWRERLDPAVAVTPLLGILDQLDGAAS